MLWKTGLLLLVFAMSAFLVHAVAAVALMHKFDSIQMDTMSIYFEFTQGVFGGPTKTCAFLGVALTVIGLVVQGVMDLREAATRAPHAR